MRSSTDYRILVFARAPVAGQVKTRLIPALGADRAVELHTRLVVRTLKLALEVAPNKVDLWCTPSAEHPFFVSCAAAYRLTLREQIGRDLGERMSSALQQTLAAGATAVLVGTDCADYSASYFRAAIDQLGAGREVVLGPAQDGGYALIGLSKFFGELFRDIDWGSSRVMQQTRMRLQTADAKSFELPGVRDIDRPEDLELLLEHPEFHWLSQSTLPAA